MVLRARFLRAARGEKAVCTKAGVITGGMRVADIAGALKFLATQPDVRADRIGLIGHSHGGWTAMRAVQKSYAPRRSGACAPAVAYYPSCAPQFDRNVDVPLLILIGDKDDWTPADRCRQLQAAGFTRPDLVEAVYYPDALHSFDGKGQGPHPCPARPARPIGWATTLPPAPDAEGADEGLLRAVFAVVVLPSAPLIGVTLPLTSP